MKGWAMAAKKTTKKKKKTSSDKMYFTKDTENAIVKFNFESDDRIRNQIFREEIEYPLYKLVENIFNTFKFQYFDVEPKKVMEETMSFVTDQLHKYDQSKGTKAYSYFSTVAKNRLIYVNNTNWKGYQKHVDISDCNEEDKNLVLDDKRAQKLKDLNEFLDLMIDYWDNNVETLFKKQRDQNIAFAVVELFRRRESLENFNKKALYLYIREMTGCKTQYITKVVNKMKEIQEKIFREYIETGVFSQRDDF
jgi:hypothetical protein